MPNIIQRFVRRLTDGDPYSEPIVEGTSTVRDLYVEAARALEAGDAERARALYRQAHAVEPLNPLALVGLGSCAMQDEAHDVAAAHNQAALELDPACYTAHIGLGSAHYLAKRYRRAAESYASALQLREDLVDAHWGSAKALHRLGERGRARAHLTRILELDPNSALARDARKLLRRRG